MTIKMNNDMTRGYRLIFPEVVSQLADKLEVTDASSGPGTDAWALRHASSPGEYMLIGGVDGGSLFAEGAPYAVDLPVDGLVIWTYTEYDGDAIKEYVSDPGPLSLSSAVKAVEIAVKMWLSDGSSRPTKSEVLGIIAFDVKIKVSGDDGEMDPNGVTEAVMSSNAMSTTDWIRHRDGLLDLARNFMVKGDVVNARNFMRLVELATALRNKRA